MKLLSVTTYNNKLYKEYAHRFESTYNWDFPYTVYNEDDGMMDTIPDCKAFVERNKNRFDNKDFIKDYWQDGVRFCYKVYAYTHAIMNYQDLDGIIGIDADSVFYKKIDEDWIKKHIHRDNCMMTYLGRPNYSECGFLYFNMKHPDIQPYANRMKSLYDTDGIYNLKEQHDSFIWDYVRKEFEKRGTKNFDIGDGKMGHVQARSILGTVYDHTKGPRRKAAGKSAEFKL
tara:strand:- start:230 stop:916 length:687 start_codon:yes stop_codon:yes gene_type:complete